MARTYEDMKNERNDYIDFHVENLVEYIEQLKNEETDNFSILYRVAGYVNGVISGVENIQNEYYNQFNEAGA